MVVADPVATIVGKSRDGPGIGAEGRIIRVRSHSELSGGGPSDVHGAGVPTESIVAEFNVISSAQLYSLLKHQRSGGLFHRGSSNNVKLLRTGCEWGLLSAAGIYAQLATIASVRGSALQDITEHSEIRPPKLVRWSGWGAVRFVVLPVRPHREVAGGALDLRVRRVCLNIDRCHSVRVTAVLGGRADPATTVLQARSAVDGGANDTQASQHEECGDPDCRLHHPLQWRKWKEPQSKKKGDKDERWNT